MASKFKQVCLGRIWWPKLNTQLLKWMHWCRQLYHFRGIDVQLIVFISSHLSASPKTSCSEPPETAVGHLLHHFARLKTLLLGPWAARGQEPQNRAVLQFELWLVEFSKSYGGLWTQSIFVANQWPYLRHASSIACKTSESTDWTATQQLFMISGRFVFSCFLERVNSKSEHSETKTYNFIWLHEGYSL